MDPLEDDFSNAKLVGPMKSANKAEAEIVNHFAGMKEDDLATLEEKPEELASELLSIRERMKVDEEREKKILDYFRSKKDRGDTILGGILLSIKEEKGRKTVDWKQYVLDEVGADGVADAEAKYSKVGASIIKVSVRKVQ